MYLQRPKDTRGFTLIEVIVAMAILGLVVSMAYSLMGFSQKSLRSSSNSYDIQNDVRLASGYLCDQIRYATELDIIPLDAVKTDTAYNYFYIQDGSLHQAKYVAATGTYDDRTIASSLSNDVADPYFSAAADSTTLGIVLTAQRDGKSYSVSTDLNLENFPLISSSLFIGGTVVDDKISDGAIRYKTQAPTTSPTYVTRITISGASDTIDTINGTLALSATVSPQDASIKSVSWSVDDPTIASVGTSGIVTAIANGTVTVTATATDGGSPLAFGSYAITISNQSG